MKMNSHFLQQQFSRKKVIFILVPYFPVILLKNFRVKRWHIQSIASCESFNFWDTNKGNTVLVRLLKTKVLAKSLKYLRKFTIGTEFLKRSRTILYHCRACTNLEVSLGYYHPCKTILATVVKFLNPRLKSVFLKVSDLKNETLQGTLSFLHQLNQRCKISEFAFDANYSGVPEIFNRDDYYDYEDDDEGRLEQFDAFVDLMRNLSSTLSKMTWLKYVYVGPSHYFLRAISPYLEMFNNLRNLTEVRFLEFLWFVEDGEFDSGYWDDTIRLARRFFQGFTNVAKLVRVTLEVNDESVRILNLIIDKCSQLKYLNLYILNKSLHNSDGFSNRVVPEGLAESLEKLGNLSQLEGFSLKYPLAEGSPEVSLYSIHKLVSLQRLSVEKLIDGEASLLNYTDLGEGIAGLHGLKYLNIEDIPTKEQLKRFFGSSSKNSLSQLSEIRFDFNSSADMFIGEEISDWMSTKLNVKCFILRLSVRKGACIVSNTVRNCCNAVLYLKNLSTLSLVFGSDSVHYGKDLPKILRDFDGEDTCILSDFLSKLSSHNLRRVKLGIADSYLTDQELHKILTAFENMPKLNLLIFGGSFKAITVEGFERLKKFIHRPRALKTVQIVPRCWLQEYEKTFANLILKTYGVSKASCFDSFFDYDVF